MLTSIVLALLFLTIPALIIYLCQKVALLDKVGVVVLAFGGGIAIAASLDLGSLFSMLFADNNMNNQAVYGIQKEISEISIALALPLLLFSIDIKSALKMAGSTLKGMALALISVIVISIVGAVIFADQVEKIWQVAGMSVGAYTGGGPNMGAIKVAINGDEDIYSTMLTYDIIFSALYLIFVMTFGQKVFGLFLKPYQFNQPHATELSDAAESMEHMTDETANSYKSLVSKNLAIKTFLSLLTSGAVVGIALGLSALVPEDIKSTTIIISITSLGLLASFIPAIRALPNSFQLGMYLILVFCFTTGSMTDTEIFTNIDVALASYISFILIGSLILQAILCKIFKIDTDTFLITSSAAIMSVPFIPVIAGALKNREILLPGFAVAIIGYAVGNYLGILVSKITLSLTGAG